MLTKWTSILKKVSKFATIFDRRHIYMGPILSPNLVHGWVNFKFPSGTSLQKILSTPSPRVNYTPFIIDPPKFIHQVDVNAKRFYYHLQVNNVSMSKFSSPCKLNHESFKNFIFHKANKIDLPFTTDPISWKNHICLQMVFIFYFRFKNMLANWLALYDWSNNLKIYNRHLFVIFISSSDFKIY